MQIMKLRASHKRKLLHIAILVGLMIVALVQKSRQGNAHLAPVSIEGGVAARLVSVVDGDTIKITIPGEGGRTVRIIGIDTPETDGPYTDYECYSNEATYALEEFLGQSDGLTLHYDPTQDRTDRYDRDLAHVYDDAGASASIHLVENGYARAYVYDDPSQLAIPLAAAQLRAQAGGVGLWGVCDL